MSLNRRIITLAASSRFIFSLIIMSTTIGGGLTILQAWYIAQIISQVHLFSASRGLLLPVLFSLLLVIVFRAIFTFLIEQSSVVFSEKIKSRLRETLSTKVLGLGPAYIDQHKSGELTYTLTNAIDALDAYFSQYLPQALMAVILPVGVLAIVFPLDLLSGFVLLLTAPLIPIFMILIGRTTEALTNRQYTAFSRMSAFFLDTLRGLSELKNLGISLKHSSRLNKVSQHYREATLQVLRVAFLSALVLELAATLSVAVIAVEIGIRLLYGQIAFQQAFFLLVIAPEFYQPLRQLGSRFHAAQNGVSAARRIFEILDQPDSGKSSTTPAKVLIENPLFQSSFEIRFENVSFAYPGRNQDAVSEVSFTLHSGTTTALVGLNGSGKSTLAALLLRFIKPQQGRILYDEMDIQTIPVSQWRAGIAWLDQHPALLNTTIYENIVLARPNATHEQISQSLLESCLDQTISSLPEGLETPLGENAHRLSGGQAQRVGLARAFLKDAPLLILDEPTSHLDVMLETELHASLAKLRQNRTCLLIAHRKTAARQANNILVMHQGRIVESGTHAELTIRQNIYAQLFGEAAL